MSPPRKRRPPPVSKRQALYLTGVRDGRAELEPELVALHDKYARLSHFVRTIASGGGGPDRRAIRRNATRLLEELGERVGIDPGASRLDHD